MKRQPLVRGTVRSPKGSLRAQLKVLVDAGDPIAANRVTSLKIAEFLKRKGYAFSNLTKRWEHTLQQQELKELRERQMEIQRKKRLPK